MRLTPLTGILLVWNRQLGTDVTADRDQIPLFPDRSHETAPMTRHDNPDITSPNSAFHGTDREEAGV